MNIRKLASSSNGKRLFFVAIGAVAGYAYYHFIGCTSGTCPISSNPYISTMYGGLMGFTLGMVKED
jgi:Family of unknown function (DUF6132)